MFEILDNLRKNAVLLKSQHYFFHTIYIFVVGCGNKTTFQFLTLNVRHSRVSKIF